MKCHIVEYSHRQWRFKWCLEKMMSKDLQNVIFGGIALALFIPTVMVGRGVLPDCDWLDRHVLGVNCSDEGT